MFLAGDEFGNSQYGNNNAYCQDNEISWLNWEDLQKNHELYEFFRYMIHFRKLHPAISGRALPVGTGFPAISLHGETPWVEHVTEESRDIGVMFAGWNQESRSEDYVYLAVNVYWEKIFVTLPELPGGKSWKLCVDTAEENSIRDNSYAPIREFGMRPRSVAVFVGRS